MSSPPTFEHAGKSPPRVALLHYASPPVVGGVESTIAHQAQGLADLGYPVRIISGSGSPFNPRIETLIHPLFGSRDPRILAAKQDLDRGELSDAFDLLVDELEQLLRQALADCAVCIVHNVHTMNKNLALTAALHRLKSPRMIAWSHDLAWTNPQYHAELHAGYPWTLLSLAWDNTRYVTISKTRQLELAALLNLPTEQVKVVTPGINPAQFLQWTPTTRAVVQKLHLLDADVLLLLPARLTRRKNIALAIQVLNMLRAIAPQDYRLIVTGPPGPHNPTNPGYLGELLTLRETLSLQHAVHFLYETETPPLIPDDTTLSNLFQLADGLLFPSVQEGFGIPLLEAGLLGLPIFCADLPPLRETGHDDVVFFDPEHDKPEAIATKIHAYFTDNPRHRLKTRVRRDYRWDVIIRQQLIPLLEEIQ